MTLDSKDAERIAKDLIAEIASEWTDTPNIRCIKQDGSYIFIYTLLPAKIIRDACIVERPTATSIFHFNPLAEAAEIVMNLSLNFHFLAPEDASIKRFVNRRSAKRRIHQMLVTASNVFGDALWQVRIIAETLSGLDSLKVFDRPDIERGLANETVKIIEQKVREGLGRISNARTPRINSPKINRALGQFMPKFKETGEIPSQRQFAKALEVTPKGWRDFLTKHRLDKHELTVKRWLEEMLGSE